MGIGNKTIDNGKDAVSKISLIILLCVIGLASLKGQNNDLQFFGLTTEMGLAESNGQYIIQDREGYIWIATLDGLNKYDGYSFKVYKKDYHDRKSLSNNKVSCLFEDRDSNLWVGTFNGLNRYNRKYDYFERIEYKDSKEEVFGDRIASIFQDQHGTIWIGTNSGVYILDTDTKRFVKQFDRISRNNNLDYCQSITADKRGNIWFGFNDVKYGGILKFNPITRDTVFFNTQLGDFNISSNRISNLLVDNQDRLWVSFYGAGIDVINTKTGQLKNYSKGSTDKSITDNNVHCMAQDKNGIIYIGSDNGLSLYNNEANTFEHHYATSRKNGLLTNTLIGNIYCAKDNSVWFSCKGGGICVLDPFYMKFKIHHSEIDNLNSIGGDNVTSFTEDKNGNIWIGSDGGGVSFFNPKRGYFKRFQHISEKKNWLPNNKALAVLADDNNGLWVGFWQGGVCYFKIKGDELIFQQHFEFLSPTIPNSNSVFKLYKSEKGDIWVGSSGTGPYKYNPKKNNFIHYPFDVKQKTQYEYQTIMDIFCDSNENMWFATTDEGLIFLDTETNEYKNFIESDGDTTGLPNIAVNVIHEDSNGTLWFGTAGGGLARFNRSSNTFQTFSVGHGLPSDMIQGMLEDDAGNFWVSTNKGLTKMTVHTTPKGIRANFRNFDPSDGLQDFYFNPWAYFKATDGSFYYGGIKGFNVFKPSEIAFNFNTPNIYLTELLLFNKPVDYKDEDSPLTKHISQTTKITLKHDQSVFTINYTALNYLKNNKVEYAYKLEGFEEEWNYVGEQRMATYTNLLPGNYMFKVIASNSDGIWNNVGVEMEIIVLPPWWKTWWFRILYISFFISLLVLIYYVRVRKLRNQKSFLEVKVKARTVELQKANKQLELNQREIQDRNEELASSEEELQQANEELHATNDNLLYQKERLESILKALKDTQQQLVESEKMATVGILTSGIAHEINNPLNFIMGGKTGLETIRDEELREHAHLFKPYLKMIDEGVNRAITIIQGLNRFNRQSDNYDEECYIHTILDNCLLMLQNDIKYVAEIERNYSQDNLCVLGNEGELHQVFINIISNALHALSSEGTIIITTSILGNSVVVSIKDNGCGILEENISKITTPFFTTKPPGQGTGLGMSISYQILKKHNGGIKYHSIPGEGTDAIITLPSNHK